MTGTVHQFPTTRKRPFNDHHRYHPELPEGVVRLPRRPPEPIKFTTRSAALLLAAMLADMESSARLRVRDQLDYLLDETPDDADLQAADQLLTAAVLTMAYGRPKP